ncbi:MAG: MBL fold metallo-hydrolase [Bacteroidota bacterium]
MTYTITAYSTALFSTWINAEELNLLFDAGDGLAAGLLQKAGKVKHVFISHADRDHVTGLPQFIQLNAREGFPKIYYPKDSGSFPAMADFLKKFDPHVSGSEWLGIKDGSIVEIKKNIEVHAVRNEHIPCPLGVHKSLSFKVYEVRQKLKREFQSLTGLELKQLVEEKGKAFISREIRTNILSYSGDTPTDAHEKWDQSEILIHEATFLRRMTHSVSDPRENKHSYLEEVLKMSKEIEVKKLILTHFSTRYSRQEIDNSTRKLIGELGIKFPVYLVYPGEIKRNILETQAINE